MPTSVPPRARRLIRSCAALVALCAISAARPAAALSTIIIEDPLGPILPGDTFSFLLRIQGSQALTGYDIELEVEALPGSFGSVVGNASLSNFHSFDNLLAQGGNGLHPSASTISSLMPANSGLFIRGLDASFASIAVPGPGQDVLAEVYMTASNDAHGEFRVSLGDDTLLAIDGVHNEEYPPAMITIRIPEPGYLGILSCLAVMFLGRRRNPA